MKRGNIAGRRSRLFLTIEELAELWGIKRSSARVQAARWAKNGRLIRLKNNFYVLGERWENLAAAELLKLANYLQVPSYISLLTALSYYEISTQVPRNIIESAAVTRTGKFQAGGRTFIYYKIKKPLFRGFLKRDGVFIATAEKALLDSLYLMSWGKYSLDTAALDLNKIDLKKLKTLARDYPAKTRKLVKQICGI